MNSLIQFVVKYKTASIVAGILVVLIGIGVGVNNMVAAQREQTRIAAEQLKLEQQRQEEIKKAEEAHSRRGGRANIEWGIASDEPKP